MRFVALFRLSPAAAFGLPDGDKTVVPGGENVQIASAILDARSGLPVSHGTISRYRLESERFEFSGTYRSTSLKAWDNFFQLTFEEESPSDGIGSAMGRMALLTRHMTVEHGIHFTSSFLQLEAVDTKIIRDPLSQPFAFLLNLATYSIAQMQERTQTAVIRAAHTDERLDKALFYYEHSKILASHQQPFPEHNNHQSLLLAAAFLSLWKGITSILGEPGTDNDYQSRFRSFGLPHDYWASQVAPLKAVRDRSDVAHYSLDSEALDTIHISYSAADTVCREIIKAYSAFLQASPPES
jgi:hypothetical protein